MWDRLFPTTTSLVATGLLIVGFSSIFGFATGLGIVLILMAIALMLNEE